MDKRIMNFENKLDEIYPVDDFQTLKSKLLLKIEQKIGSFEKKEFAGDWLTQIISLSKNAQAVDQQHPTLYTGLGGELYLLLLLYFEEIEKLKRIPHPLAQENYCSFLLSEIERISFLCLTKLRIPLQIVGNSKILVDTKQEFLQKYCNLDNSSFLDGKYGILVLLSISFSELFQNCQKTLPTDKSEDEESRLQDLEIIKNFLISLVKEFEALITETPDLQKYAEFPENTEREDFISNELLYGRAGCLWGAEMFQNYLNYHFFSNMPSTSTSPHLKHIFIAHLADHIKKTREIIKTIIISGQTQTKYLLENYEFPTEKNKPKPDSLVFHWHGKDYLGGIHGTSGILFVLNAKIMNYFSKESQFSKNLQKMFGTQIPPQIQKELEDFRKDSTIAEFLSKNLQSTTEFLISFQFATGNFPSRPTNDEDRLVQFCHGPLGPIALICGILENFDFFAEFPQNSENFLKILTNSLKLALDCVWQRGLLRKGFGICHGVGGNCYSFLWFLICLSKITRKNNKFCDSVVKAIKNSFKEGEISQIIEKWQKRMLKFASFMVVHPEKPENVEKEWKSIQTFLLSKPDHPLSLFEGIGGTCVLLDNIKSYLTGEDSEEKKNLNLFPCFGDFPFPTFNL